MSDSVSRQAAIAYAISGRIRTLPTTEDGEDWIRVSEVRESILNMPSAERRGKWIYLDGLDAFECSICGRQMVRNIFDYCPWCGAKMESEE